MRWRSSTIWGQCNLRSSSTSTGLSWGRLGPNQNGSRATFFGVFQVHNSGNNRAGGIQRCGLKLWDLESSRNFNHFNLNLNFDRWLVASLWLEQNRHQTVLFTLHHLPVLPLVSLQHEHCSSSAAYLGPMMTALKLMEVEQSSLPALSKRTV